MRVFASLLATLLLASGNAHAQSRDVQKADTLFREGRALMTAGDLDAACPKLEKSYQFDPAPGTAVNLGDCFDKQGKVGSALLAYQAARKLLKPGDPRIGPVEKQIDALEKRVPKLTITLASDAPEGTRVTRDGKFVDFADFGRALPMNPGEVVIVVTAPGRRDEKLELVLAEGEPKEIAATIGAPLGRGVADGAHSQSPNPGGAAGEPTSSGESQRTIGFVLGGVGVLALVAGGGLLVKANAKEDDATNAGCTSSKCPNAVAQGLSDEGDSARRQATWSAGLGALALVGGVALVLTSATDSKTDVRLKLAPIPVAGGAAAQIRGTW